MQKVRHTATIDLYESHCSFLYVIYHMWCHSYTTRENIQVICGNSVQCKCNELQLSHSTIAICANYVMIVKITPSRNVRCMWKWSLCSKSSSLMVGVNYSSMVFLVGVKEEGGKLIPIMMNLDSIPQAIIEVVICEFKTDCCIGVVMPYNTTALHTPLPNGTATQLVSV